MDFGRGWIPAMVTLQWLGKLQKKDFFGGLVFQGYVRSCIYIYIYIFFLLPCSLLKCF